MIVEFWTNRFPYCLRISTNAGSMIGGGADCGGTEVGTGMRAILGATDIGLSGDGGNLSFSALFFRVTAQIAGFLFCWSGFDAGGSVLGGGSRVRVGSEDLRCVMMDSRWESWALKLAHSTSVFPERI